VKNLQENKGKIF